MYNTVRKCVLCKQGLNNEIKHENKGILSKVVLSYLHFTAANVV